MTPTHELRFVEREVITPYGNDGAQVSKTVRILQQKWEIEPKYSPYTGFRPEVVWRDVPVEKEPKQ